MASDNYRQPLQCNSGLEPLPRNDPILFSDPRSTVDPLYTTAAPSSRTHHHMTAEVQTPGTAAAAFQRQQGVSFHTSALAAPNTQYVPTTSASAMRNPHSLDEFESEESLLTPQPNKKRRARNRPNHNEVERNRRIFQRQKLEELRQVLPGLDPTVRTTITTVIVRAREYIDALQARVNELDTQLEQMHPVGAYRRAGLPQLPMVRGQGLTRASDQSEDDPNERLALNQPSRDASVSLSPSCLLPSAVSFSESGRYSAASCFNSGAAPQQEPTPAAGDGGDLSHAGQSGYPLLQPGGSLDFHQPSPAPTGIHQYRMSTNLQDGCLLSPRPWSEQASVLPLSLEQLGIAPNASSFSQETSNPSAGQELDSLITFPTAFPPLPSESHTSVNPPISPEPGSIRPALPSAASNATSLPGPIRSPYITANAAQSVGSPFLDNAGPQFSFPPHYGFPHASPHRSHDATAAAAHLGLGEQLDSLIGGGNSNTPSLTAEDGSTTGAATATEHFGRPNANVKSPIPTGYSAISSINPLLYELAQVPSMVKDPNQVPIPVVASQAMAKSWGAAGSGPRQPASVDTPDPCSSQGSFAGPTSLEHVSHNCQPSIGK